MEENKLVKWVGGILGLLVILNVFAALVASFTLLIQFIVGG